MVHLIGIFLGADVFWALFLGHVNFSGVNFKMFDPKINGWNTKHDQICGFVGTISIAMGSEPFFDRHKMCRRRLWRKSNDTWRRRWRHIPSTIEGLKWVTQGQFPPEFAGLVGLPGKLRGLSLSARRRFSSHPWPKSQGLGSRLHFVWAFRISCSWLKNSLRDTLSS